MCRYKTCKHESKDIDITKDDFVNEGKSFYHSDCYKAKTAEDEAKKKKTADLMYFRNLWIDNISNTVVCSQLFKIVNDLLSRGIELEYLIFVLEYCIEHKLNLNYPAGFYYFVDKEEIKMAYTKKKIIKSGYNKNSFMAIENDDTSPKFSVQKKSNGFQNILKNNN